VIQIRNVADEQVIEIIKRDRVALLNQPPNVVVMID